MALRVCMRSLYGEPHTWSSLQREVGNPGERSGARFFSPSTQAPLLAAFPDSTHPYFHNANRFFAGSEAVGATGPIKLVAHLVICSEKSDLLSRDTGSPTLMDRISSL